MRFYCGEQPFSGPGDAAGGEAGRLLELYHKLLARFGPQGWWPARSRLEIVVGAVLVQSTSWENTVRALNNLRRAKALNWAGLNCLEARQLAGLIRPCGCHNLKAGRLLNLLAMLAAYQPWHSFFRQGLLPARQALLQVNGVGPETADAILLYAGGKAVFVADAYTLRILSRHRWLPPQADYAQIQAFFMERLPAEVALFREFHALLVLLGKRHCHKSRPSCAACPLNREEP